MTIYIQALEIRQFKMIVLLIVFVLSALLFTYLVLPEVKNFRKLSKTYSVLSEAVANTDKLDSQINTEKELVETLNKKLHGDMANLPVRQMEAYIIGRLQKISWQHKVEFSGVRPYLGEKIKNFQEILFDVDAGGEYSNLYMWIRELRTDLGFVVIKQFEIMPLNVNEETPSLKVKLTMASYRGI